MRLRVLGSLRGRLAAAAAAAILAAVLLFAAVTVLVVRHELRSSLDGALQDRATVVAQLAVSAPAVLDYPGSLESSASGRQLDVEVLDSHGRILARSAALGAAVLPQDRLVRAALQRGITGVQGIRLDRRPYRMFVAPIADAGGPAAGGAVLVASDASYIGQTISRLVVSVALAGAAVALLATLAAAVLTRRGLRPLRRLAAAAGEIERTPDPARRLPEPASVDEVGQLTGVLNRMLASLERARAGERRFLADASHELRTPVTALLGNVEYAARHGADPELLDELRHDARRLARLVDELLELERASSTAAGATAPVALDELTREVVAQHDAGRVRLAAAGPVRVSGDEAALRRAIGNLIENGLVHGPEGGIVTVEVGGFGDRARVRVRDQGPGPDPAHHAELFERFWRAPEAATRPGSGLGLPIVAAVAARHGGIVTVDGSRFTLELPLGNASKAL